MNDLTKPQDAVLSIRLTAEAKAHLRAWCEARQLRPAAFYLAAITERMARVEAAEGRRK